MSAVLLVDTLVELEDVHHAPIDVVARTLARICRFGGRLPQDGPLSFHSVAEHCVLVRQILRAWGFGPLAQWYGLLHDGHEALIGDIATPVKNWIGAEHMASREGKLMDAFLRVQGLPPMGLVEAPAVWHADQVALATEAQALGLDLSLFGEDVASYAELSPSAASLRAWNLLQPDPEGETMRARVERVAQRFVSESGELEAQMRKSTGDARCCGACASCARA